MKSYEVTNLIIDEETYGEEHITVEMTVEQENYIITFQKSDLELINAWRVEDGTTLPADLSENLLDSIKEDIKKKI
ncbi:MULTISPECIES: hypothetical protein [Mesobacillus]|uniref:Uncharacterized protein n=1 Tax=Mesobacillus selenatarsenatis TaxID=388741 RepID=A0A846TC95_9BACI|nr:MULTISPECIES: hypothetical protein [Mesobacillus]NKE03874.1 hypothetical protein [Mesobacillus selenatarsenatis]